MPYHTWGRCWRKEGDLLSESSLWGWYLILRYFVTCPNPFRWHAFSFVVLCEFHKYPYTHCAQQGDVGYL